MQDSIDAHKVASAATAFRQSSARERELWQARQEAEQAANAARIALATVERDWLDAYRKTKTDLVAVFETVGIDPDDAMRTVRALDSEKAFR